MTKFVLDSSVAATWFFEDEYSQETDELLILARDYGIVVPALSPFEIGNVFLQAEKKGRQTFLQMTEKMSAFAEMPIEIDHGSTFHHLSAILQLARSHGLTVYDAAYLELAMRRGIPLATKDKPMREAAKAVGLKVLPEHKSQVQTVEILP